MRTALLSLFFCLMSIGLLAQDSGYTVILPEAKGDINDTVWQKDYFGHFSLQNTGKDTLFLSQAQLTPFADVHSGPPVPSRLSMGEKRRDAMAIPSGQVVRIGIDASFKQAGTYLAIFTAQTRQDTAQRILTKKIRVVRSLRRARTPQAFFAIQDIVRATGDMSAILLRVVVQDTVGNGGTLLPPLVTLQRKLSDTENGQADYVRIRVTDTLGQTLKQLDFAPSEAKTLLVQVEGLAEPGTYSGEFAVTGTGGPTALKPFVVTARRAWWAALLWITAGLLLSLLLRWLIQVIQPRLERQNRVAVLIQGAEALETQSAAHPDELAVLANLQLQLAELYDLLAREMPKDLEDRLKVLDHKLHLLPVWAAARRAVFALKPVKLRDAFLPKLDAARDFIKGYGGTKEKATELEKSLQTIDQGILDTVSGHINNGVTKMLEGIQVGDLKFTPVELKRLKTKSASIQALEPRDQVEMTEKSSAYDDFRNDYTDLMLGKLKTEFAEGPPTQVMELGVSKEAWQIATTQARTELQDLSSTARINVKINTIQAALRSYALPVAELSLKKVTEVLQYNDNLVPADKEILGQHKNLLQRKVELIRNVHTEADWRESPLISYDLGEVLKITAKKVELAPRGIKMRGPSSPTTTETTNLGSTILSIPGDVHFSAVESLSPEESPARKVNIWKLRMMLFFTELATSSLLLVISGLLGLLILWNANPTWGSIEDILYAILWGFGLHTASKTTDMSGGPFKFVTGKLK